MIDEVIREIHAIKDANARKYRGSLAAMMRALRRRQEQSGRKIIRVPGTPMRKRKAAISVAA